MSERRWSIGELAKAGGVTVRTLHHYDRIGLVSPGERTPAGHRRYTEADVRRLYRVRTLCGLGLSLDEVAAVLRNARDDLGSLRDLLTAQLAGPEARAARIEESAQRLRGLLARLAEAGMPEPEQFLATLEPMSVDAGRYLSGGRLTTITERAAQLGGGTVETLKTEWLGLFAELRRHLLAGTPVDDRPPRTRTAAGHRRRRSRRGRRREHAPGARVLQAAPPGDPVPGRGNGVHRVRDGVRLPGGLGGPRLGARRRR
ncbi:MerR family transcriptional regulator [Amycolatopsis sp. CA-126428]|uniref:MerR family transcriptional regulator n=1 Tax=Amycolatopsis sp. CA-126428 TaxID=2073158 RepID=UPI001E4D4541|nr:MerR family transcriptional regulator [Amycolatopsis sp. CA-126428]